MINSLNVFYHKKKVGILFISKSKRICFCYDKEWLSNGFSISPISLPLEERIFEYKKTNFNGLFGVFADSFVDSWGELLLKNYLKSKGIKYSDLNILEKLAYIGKNPMGALEYYPNYSTEANKNNLDLDKLQDDFDLLLNNKNCENIDEVFKLGGSSSGTRPKILTTYNGKDVLIKFSSKFDPKNAVELEFEYMSKAKEAGINIPYIELLQTKKNKYFLIERFDRKNGEKIHMISVSGLLEVDHNVPSLDYFDLIKLTKLITRNEDDVIEMFRRMVFNAVFENLDDHTKNFAFLYDEDNEMFRLSPAYDLTPTTTYYGEHTTSVNGKGKNIEISDMMEIARKANIKETTAIEIIKKITNLKQ